MINDLRRKLGVAVFDIPRWIYHLFIGRSKHRSSWIYICNRDEKLTNNKESYGVKCLWELTSDLYLPSIYPRFGGLLFNKAIREYSFNFQKEPDTSNPSQPDVSFIIGHRGLERVPLLLKTLESIAAQKHCSIECIVVEQDVTPQVKPLLPEWVKYQFSKIPSEQTAYSRARAFNKGAACSLAQCLIFHDNDLLVPQCYAVDTFNKFNNGYDFINLKRYIFYADSSSSRLCTSNSYGLRQLTIDVIMQNAEGGGSIGASKTAFNQIGRFDRRFIGWGGEDNEFWQRAQTKLVYDYTYLPLIHLWHDAQPEKVATQNSQRQTLFTKLSKQSPTERIEYLTNLDAKATD